MFDIIKHYDKVSPELVEKFSKFEESASIHESMGRKGAMGGKIHTGVTPGVLREQLNRLKVKTNTKDDSGKFRKWKGWNKHEEKADQ